MKEQLAPTNQIPNELRILTNVAFLMADVTDTFLLDAYSRVRSLGMDFKREEKQKWKRAVEQTRLARRAWQEVSEKCITCQMLKPLAKIATSLQMSYYSWLTA